MKFEGVNPDAFPIQIVNGVISLVFGRGCLGCKWCITKRQDGRDVLQEISYKNLLTGETLFKLLSKCLAFSEAKLPLRIGNNTDGTLIPIQELSCFLNEVKDHPTMLLTRGMHSRSLNVLLSQQGKNFMLAHTLTFPHESLQYYFKPEKLLRCFLDAQCKKVLNIGPICVQNMGQVESFLDSRVLEYGTKVIFAPLNLRKLPSSVIFDLTAEPINFLQRTYLESKARSLGLDVLRSNNCALALVTGRKSLEFGDINNGVVLDDSKTTGTSNYIPDAILCDGCLNRNKCASSPEYSNKLLNELLDRLLLPRSRIITSGNMLLQIGVEGITKAETSYLSGMLGLRVTSPNSENIPSPTSLERWSRSGFYPVEEIVELSNEFDPMQVIFRN